MKDRDTILLENIYGQVSEGMLHVPEKIMQPIKDYFLEVYKKFKTELRKKITKKTFPRKIIYLDLSGTPWEFLEKEFHEDPIGVAVYFTASDKAWAEHRQIQNNVYPILLSLEDPEKSLYHINEHEASHVIQFFLERLAEKNFRKKYGILASIEKKPEMAGVPPKKVLPQTDITLHGYSKKSLNDYQKNNRRKRVRRVEHTNRPIEYYPDLLTAVRDLRWVFEEKVLNSDDPNIPEEMKRDTTKNRAIFFNQFYKELHFPENDPKPYPFKLYSSLSYADRIMAQFKKMGGEMWRHMLKTAYNAFVNGGPNFDYRNIKTELAKIDIESKESKEKKKEKMKEKGLPENFEFEKGEPRWDFGDFYHDMLDNISEDTDDNITDNRYEWGNDLISDLSLKRRENSYGDEYVFAPKDNKGIRRLFQKLRKLRDETKPDELPFSTEKDLTQQEVHEIYDSVFQSILDTYKNVISYRQENRRKELEDFIYSSYYPMV